MLTERDYCTESINQQMDKKEEKEEKTNDTNNNNEQPNNESSNINTDTNQVRICFWLFEFECAIKNTYVIMSHKKKMSPTQRNQRR